LREIGRGDSGGVPGRPLNELDPVPVGIGEPRGPWSLQPTRKFNRTGPQAVARQRLGACDEVINLNDEVAESGADYDRSLAWPVHQFDADDLLAWKLEHRQAVAVTKVDAANLAIPKRCVEVQRGIQVGDSVRAMEGPHRTMVFRRSHP